MLQCYSNMLFKKAAQNILQILSDCHFFLCKFIIVKYSFFLRLYKSRKFGPIDFFSLDKVRIKQYVNPDPVYDQN